MWHERMQNGAPFEDAEDDTGPCDKCQGSGKLFDRRIGDVECDECSGHGWFNDGVASPMRMPGCGVLPDGGYECVCGQCGT